MTTASTAVAVTLDELLRSHVARFVDRAPDWDAFADARGEDLGLEPAYLQVMLGRARPDLTTYTDPALQSKRDTHLGTVRS
jgi:hypothetical protein